MQRESREGVLWQREIAELQSRSLHRVMPKIDGLPGRFVTVNGIRAVNFSSNNYLGLAGHPQLIERAAQYAARYGAGSTASRLIAGNNEPHRELESFIAAWKGTEAALVFGSGYQANVGILSSLARKGDLIISDELNHASIIDGCRLSGAQVKVYPHRDLGRLESWVKLTGFGRKIVVTESVFSMDGDVAPLAEIAALCSREGAVLMVDEAHATGAIGPKGTGVAAELGIVPDIQMGTLGKAVGAAGAYVAGGTHLIELLTNRARSLIYTTAPAPAVVGAALAGLAIIASQEGEERRTRLKTNVQRFAGIMFDTMGVSSGSTHIYPFTIGDSSLTMNVSRACLQRGVFAHGIRYPTVPEGSARIRFTLMSDHTAEDLELAVATLDQSLAEERNN
ncbi:MAG: 8-amino-7-oxononanoate synthase [Pseudomonadota bacterium]